MILPLVHLQIVRAVNSVSSNLSQKSLVQGLSLWLFQDKIYVSLASGFIQSGGVTFVIVAIEFPLSDMVLLLLNLSMEALTSPLFAVIAAICSLLASYRASSLSLLVFPPLYPRFNETP